MFAIEFVVRRGEAGRKLGVAAEVVVEFTIKEKGGCQKFTTLSTSREGLEEKEGVNGRLHRASLGVNGWRSFNKVRLLNRPA